MKKKIYDLELHRNIAYSLLIDNDFTELTMYFVNYLPETIKYDYKKKSLICYEGYKEENVDEKHDVDELKSEFVKGLTKFISYSDKVRPKSDNLQQKVEEILGKIKDEKFRNR